MRSQLVISFSSDYGEMENKNIADKYEVKAEQFPVIKLFNDGDLANPVSFDRGMNKLIKIIK